MKIAVAADERTGVADGRADQAVVCCWTGTGASIAAKAGPSRDMDDRANVDHLAQIE